MIFREKTITEMAAQYGVSLRTLRFYENRGLLHPIRRGYYRYYLPKDEIRLALILKGKRLGFSLSEITRLIDGSSKLDIAETETDAPELASLLQPAELAKQIASLETKRSQLDEAITELQQKLAQLSSEEKLDVFHPNAVDYKRDPAAIGDRLRR